LAKYSIDLTSPHEPFEMYKNLLNSKFVFLSYPSAMLFIIETEALQIWSLNEKSLQVPNNL